MARSSPGVMRVAAILNFMADHPGQSFALTDLVRALKLSRATCHALLTGLVEVGYLYRSSDKSYVLGPALAAIGRTAAAHFAPMQVAQPEMRSLADEYDVVCSAFFLEGDAIVSRERAASVSHVGYSIPLGTRVKLRPRSMSVFYAWSPAEAAALLDAADPPVSPEQREAAEASMAFARQNGFLVHVRTDTAVDPSALDMAFGADDANFPVGLLTSLSPGTVYALSSVNAPVFDGDGNVAFVLGLMGFDRSMTGAEIAAVAERLRGACDRVGSFISGRRGGGTAARG
jgi:DNA-binding IclR family transcriptional regulator